MKIFLLKLLLTPILIVVATLAGRRWGPKINGMLVGLPLTTGPISFVLANQNGPEFAVEVVAGNLVGQVSMCGFCVVFSRTGRRRSWAVSALVALTSWLAASFVLDQFSWSLLPAFGALSVSIVAALSAIPRQATGRNEAVPPRWDLPARVAAATTLVFLLTNFADALGPQLTGLLSTFPIFAVIFASFTHSQQGPEAASPLLHGIIHGLFSYCAFFLVVGICLVPLGIGPTYLIALIAAVSSSVISHRLTRR